MRTCGWRLVAVMALLAGVAVVCGAEPYLPLQMADLQFDPKCAEPMSVTEARLATTLGSTVSPDRNYYVVQFQGPVRWAWKRQAAEMGAVLLDYVPRYAFVARMTAAEAAAVAGLPFVRWVAPFPPQWKYPRSLTAIPTRGVAVLVRLFPGETFERIGGFVEDRRLWYLGFDWKPSPTLRLGMPAAAVPDLAALPEVSWIEEYKHPQLSNELGQRFLGVSNVAGLPHPVDVWNDYGLFGTGQIVAVADTGLDTGNLATLHPDFRDAFGAPRVVAAFGLAVPWFWGDFHGHGTHVAGSVLGSGARSGANVAGRFYTGSFAGGAPEASLAFQSLGPTGALVGIPMNFGDLFDQAYRAGARIHTNSWGADVYPGRYTYRSAMVDEYLWRNQDMTILFSAGNAGQDLNLDGVVDWGSMGQPATAKNCITVGATESYRPPFVGWGGVADYTWRVLGYLADPIASDYTSDNPSGMAAFSSRGPCVEGRIKPDVVAPGVNIISCLSQLASVTPQNRYDDWYSYNLGTSMATPLTAGTAALVRQYYTDVRGHSSPSGALIKATLIHGATDLAPGQYGTGPQQEIFPAPDRSQGWGRPNIGTTIFPERVHPSASLVFFDYGLISDTGFVDVHPVVVTDTTTPLTVTLTWTDAPAAPFVSTALVNDLDLIVVDPIGQRYRGNFGSTPMNDRINNVERLRFPTPRAGNYYLLVSGFNVPVGPQAYALVVTGTTATTYRITGQVVDQNGRGLSGVAVTVEGIATSPGRRVTAVTRSDGTYAATNLLPGRYRVTPSRAYYDFLPRERRIDVVAADVGDVNFVGAPVMTYEIAGFVWDESGRGVPGLTVLVYGADLWVFAVTDANGQYIARDLPGGSYWVLPPIVPDRFVTPGWRTLTLPNRESYGQHFWISHPWSGMIDIHTLTPARTAIAATMVTVERRQWDGSFAVVAQSQTNSQGFARIGGTSGQILLDGYYRVSVSKVGYSFQVTPFTPSVEGYLPPVGPYSGLLTATTGAFYFWGDSPAPTYNARGLVRTRFDRAVPDVAVRLTGLTTGRVFQARTRSDGFYHVTGMPADIYRVEAQKPGWRLTPVNPLTGVPDAYYDASTKVGPPAHVPPVSEYVLYLDPWELGFAVRDLAYQYPDGRQDYWADSL